MLQMAARLGETVIVTNGGQGWVEESACRYMPATLQLIETIPVISARMNHASAHPNRPILWKYLTFQDLLAKKQNSMSPDNGVNLIVLGDSLVEIKAARTAAKAMSAGSLLKTLRFKHKPTAHELHGQLSRLALELDTIVQEDTNSSRALI